MYFLSDEEKKQLARVYLPRAREAGVAEELRGWHWDQPPLLPIYDVRLAVFDVADHYCPKDRSLFFRRVEHRRGNPTQPMLQGGLFHALMAKIIMFCKRHIYAGGIENVNLLREQVLREGEEWIKTQHVEMAKDWPDEWWSETERKALELLHFEIERIWARIQEVLIHQPYIQEDSLVALAIPVVVEQKLNGSFLGLSGMLSTDALTYAEPIVVDLKFGPRRDFYRLATTGYALVLEALHDFPVNIGCIVYAQFKHGRWQIERDIHVIGDEMRQRFVEERDEKMRLIYEEIDPGPGINCQVECAYKAECAG